MFVQTAVYQEAERVIKEAHLPAEKEKDMLEYAETELKKIQGRFGAQANAAIEVDEEPYEVAVKKYASEAVAAVAVLLEEIKQKLRDLNTSEKK